MHPDHHNVPGFAPPRRIETSRLLLRAWELGDAPALKEAIDRNIDHLLPWIPWAYDQPQSLEENSANVARFISEFDHGITWLYGIFEKQRDTLLGGIGLHPRIGPGGVEIGYWLDRGVTGRGYITEACREFVQLAFANETTTHVEIRCDPRNTASAAIPQRLGFMHAYTLKPQSGRDPSAELSELMIWRQTRRDFR